MSLSFRYLWLSVLCGFCGSSAAETSAALPPLHHPVEIMVPGSMRLPAEFSLGAAGELICDTCHGVEGLQETPLDEVDMDRPDFLHFGPYRDLTDFCYQCHEEQGHERYNLHRMIDDQGRIDDSGCIYCHMETPDPNKPDQIGDMKFRLPKEKLCYGCHLKTPHLNALTHQAEPNEKIREAIRQAEKKHTVNLPLDDRGWVGCITCHTPHQAGVIDADRPGGKQVEEASLDEGMAYRRTAWGEVFARDKAKRMTDLKRSQPLDAVAPEYLRVEKEVLLRLPAKDGTLCLSCHDFED